MSKPSEPKICIANTATQIPLRAEFEKLFASEVLPSKINSIEEVLKKLDPDNQARLKDRWVDYVEGEYKEDCWNDYLADIEPKDLTSIKKTKLGRAASNQRRKLERQEQWFEYEPFMLDYFKKNPTQNLTAARERCAKKFGVAPITVRRHTKGFTKPTP